MSTKQDINDGCYSTLTEGGQRGGNGGTKLEASNKKPKLAPPTPTVKSGVPLTERQRLRSLAAKVRDLKSGLDRDFKRMSDKCNCRKTKQGPGPHYEYYSCEHQDYPFRKYELITPCSLDKCPLLK